MIKNLQNQDVNFGGMTRGFLVDKGKLNKSPLILKKKGGLYCVSHYDMLSFLNNNYDNDI